MNNQKATNTPPRFPGAEAMQAAHENYLQWERSEEGQRFMRDHLPPEEYAHYLEDLKTDGITPIE